MAGPEDLTLNVTPKGRVEAARIPHFATEAWVQQPVSFEHASGHLLLSYRAGEDHSAGEFALGRVRDFERAVATL